jgi:uncharacterized protein YjiS (DUF1127 family)
MNDMSTLASAPHQVSRRHHGLASLRSMIATWRRRIRFRRELAQKAKATPHLIEDMGLRRWQVEEELAKPFWRG